MPKFELDPDCYYYEHTNGEIIRKPYIVVQSGGGPGTYFKGPMVRRWWRGNDFPEDLVERLGIDQ